MKDTIMLKNSLRRSFTLSVFGATVALLSACGGSPETVTAPPLLTVTKYQAITVNMSKAQVAAIIGTEPTASSQAVTNTTTKDIVQTFDWQNADQQISVKTTNGRATYKSYTGTGFSYEITF